MSLQGDDGPEVQGSGGEIIMSLRDMMMSLRDMMMSLQSGAETQEARWSGVGV